MSAHRAMYEVGPTFDVPDAPKGLMVPGLDGSIGSEYIPVTDPDYHFRKEYISDMCGWWALKQAGSMRDSLYLFGEAAAGKTSLVQQFFARLNVPVISITGDEDRDVPELISFRQIVDGDTVTDDGPITRAMRMGAVLLINEISYFRPQTLSALNDVIEAGKVLVPESSELVVAAPTFAVVVTDNTNGTADPEGRYAGTKGQNEAFLDRFTFVKVATMSADEEVSVLQRRFPSQKPELLGQYVAVANMVRTACTDGRLGQTMSLRSLCRWINWTAIKSRTFGPQAIYVALDRAFGFRLFESERQALDEFVRTMFAVTRD